MRFTALFLIMLAGTVSVTAQHRTLTLDQAISMALERNLDVLQAQNNVESAQATVLAARGDYLPTLSASAGWTRTQNDRPGSSPIILPDGTVIPGQSGFSVTNSFSTGLNANYTIFDGFRREASVGRAISSAVASEQQAARTRQAIVFATQRAYINMLRTGQLVGVSEENLKRGQRQLERITESNRVGALSLADVYRQQSQVAQDELSVITAQNNHNKAKADLVALIGLDVFDEYTFSDPSLPAEITSEDLTATMQQYASISSLSERALASRPDYLGARESFEAADAGVTAARSGYLPSINAFAGYSLSNPELSRISDNKNLNWGLNLRWTIFDGFQTNQSLQSAYVAKRNAEVTLRQTELDINVEIKKALLDLEAARKAYDVTQKGLISATEDRRIAEERYNLGAGTLLDLLTANAGLVNAEANKVNAAYDYVIAKRNVEYVLGERSY